MRQNLIIISIISTIVILLVLINLYAPYKPIILTFEIEGNGDLDLQIFYNQKSNNNFKNKNSIKKSLKLPVKKIDIFLPIKKLERLKIELGYKPGKIELGGIIVNNQKQIFWNNLENIQFSQIEHKRVVGDSLIFFSTNSNPSITFAYNLNIKAQRGFKIELFITFLIVVFLLSYKIVKYLSEFKTVDKHSRIDILFVSLFFIMLFIPMSNISSDEKSSRENRVLTAYKKLIIDGEINLGYGKNFENWFNDRFLGRERLIDAYDFIISKINIKKESDKCFVGKDGWMFDKRNDFGVQNLISNDDLEKYKTNIERLLLFCKENKTKCYLLIVPRKIDFAFNKTYRNPLSYIPDYTISLKNYIQSELNFEIIYPLDEMLEANKEDLVYYKTDHHWTHWGTFVCYKALMKQIKRDFPLVPIISENDLEKYFDIKVQATWNQTPWIGNTAKLLKYNENSAILDTYYRFYRHKRRSELFAQEDDSLNDNDDVFYYKYGLDKRVLIIGNSFAENFVSFLPYSFKNVRRLYSNYRGMELMKYNDIINGYKPDIIILLFHSSYISLLLDLYKD